jgi:hypothetical protein
MLLSIIANVDYINITVVTEKLMFRQVVLMGFIFLSLE